MRASRCSVTLAWRWSPTLPSPARGLRRQCANSLVGVPLATGSQPSARVARSERSPSGTACRCSTPTQPFAGASVPTLARATCLSTLLERTGAVDCLDDVNPRLQTRPPRVLVCHHAAELIFGTAFDKVDGAASEPGAGKPAGHDAGDLLGYLDHHVQLGRTHLQKVAQGTVGGGEQPPDCVDVVSGEGLHSLYHPIVLVDDVLTATGDDLRQAIAIPGEHRRRDVSERPHVGLAFCYQ